MIVIKSAAEIGKMRQAGRIVAEVLDMMRERVAPGVTTAELDGLAENYGQDTRRSPRLSLGNASGRSRKRQ